MHISDEIKKIIHPLNKGVKLFITIGNTLRSDDGVGPYIAANIPGFSDNAELINAGMQPENIIDNALEIKPKETIIIDAADFKGLPGEIRLIPDNLISDVTLSTHTFPLSIISRMIEEDTGSKVYFVGIQPRDMSLGETLSKEVKQTADSLIKIIKKEFCNA